MIEQAYILRYAIDLHEHESCMHVAVRVLHSCAFICCGIGQVLHKPWRVIELTACAMSCTYSPGHPGPKDIVRVEHKTITPFRVYSTLTEIIITNKFRDIIIV